MERLGLQLPNLHDNDAPHPIMTASATIVRRSVGRPRSEATRTEILAATVRLLETQSVQSITIEGIAREAGVGKATIYRWWDSKALVVIDAFMEHHLVKTPMPRDLPPGAAIAQHLRTLIREYAGWSGRIVAQIIAEGQSDPSVLREFRERFHYGRRAVVREVLEAWRQESNIPVPTHIETLSDLLYGPVYMRLLLGHGPLDEDFANNHISYAFSLLGVDLKLLEEGAKRATRSRTSHKATSKRAAA